MNLSSILSVWAEDKLRFKDFESTARKLLENSIRNKSVIARVISRTKDDLSLAKKLLKKGSSLEAYNSMTDRVGLRVICRFREDLEPACNAVREAFDVVAFEDKSSLLSVRENGYRSLHFDVKLREPISPVDETSEAVPIVCEIQVRTLCEDVWAEVFHDLGYKPLMDLPDVVARRLFCLGGLLEVADDSFSAIRSEVDHMKELQPISALRALETAFLKVNPTCYDSELSLIALSTLLTIVEADNTAFAAAISAFTNTNESKLRQLFAENAGVTVELPYLSQPESILIFFLLEKDPFRLVSIWQSRFPIEDLEKLSLYWGHPIGDLIEN